MEQQKREGLFMSNSIMDSVYRKYEMSGRFDSKQLYILGEGIRAGMDTAKYADPDFSYKQMEQILLGLLSGMDVAVYAKHCFSEYQMAQIRAALEHHLKNEQIALIADPMFDEWQMSQIRVGFEVGIPAEEYADPSLSWREMRKEYERLCSEKHRLDSKILSARTQKTDTFEYAFPQQELLR